MTNGDLAFFVLVWWLRLGLVSGIDSGMEERVGCVADSDLQAYAVHMVNFVQVIALCVLQCLFEIPRSSHLYWVEKRPTEDVILYITFVQTSTNQWVFHLLFQGLVV